MQNSVTFFSTLELKYTNFKTGLIKSKIPNNDFYRQNSNLQQIQLTDMQDSGALSWRRGALLASIFVSWICEELPIIGLRQQDSQSQTIYGVGRTITYIRLSNLCRSNIKRRCDDCVAQTVDWHFVKSKEWHKQRDRQTEIVTSILNRPRGCRLATPQPMSRLQSPELGGLGFQRNTKLFTFWSYCNLCTEYIAQLRKYFSKGLAP